MPWLSVSEAVQALLPHMGWQKVVLSGDRIVLPAGMEIDLGGIAKEFAVDRALGLARAITPEPVLVNFGGDLAVSEPRKDGSAWKVAIESVAHSGAAALLELRQGAIATSGDARRFLEKDGVRYGHILDPRTGWPVVSAFRSITVAAATCLEAGMLATMAILQGPDAETFLQREKVRAWFIR